ncbi:MAG: radical SAM protein [Planctomycetota bacterium]
MSIALTLPVLGGSGCETGGCSAGGGCGTNGTQLRQSQTVDSLVEVPFQARRLDLSAAPTEGSFVRSIDLDLTVECNLRCTYCFKEKWNEHMEESVAFDTMVWLLHASGPVRDIRVNFMGGEPLIRFRLIKKLVPFAKRRAAQMGKSIHFGMTTNGTLVTEEVVEFWRSWGMGFHTSIDGTPDVQDKNRPTTSGRGSSHLVAKAVPKILAYRPGTCARSTVTPESASTLVDSYHYFRSLGYFDIAFVPGGPSHWDAEKIAVFEEQFSKVADLAADEMRSGTYIRLKGLTDFVEGVRRGRSPVACGAGRALLLIDIHGDIWPCHRWNKGLQDSWRIGSIYQQFNEARRAILDVADQTALLEQDCPKCVANQMCSGGCPAENLEETGSVYRRHWNACELTRATARVAGRVHQELVAENNATYTEGYMNADT